MIYDEKKWLKVNSLLERYFDGELRISEVKLKLSSLDIETSDVEALVNSARDAKRDIQRGM